MRRWQLLNREEQIGVVGVTEFVLRLQIYDVIHIYSRPM